MRYFEKLPENFKKRQKTYIALVGGRDVDSYNFVKENFLKNLPCSAEQAVIVSGGAKGVDSFARKIAEELNIPIIEIIPNWKKFGKKAGMVRNSEILKISDFVIAIPGPSSRGTWDTIRKAKNMKIPCIVVEYKRKEISNNSSVEELLKKDVPF